MHIKSGFTLLELLITITLIAITAAIAFPNFQTLFQQSQAKVQAQRLLQSLHLARSESLLRGVTITLCASSNHQTCTENWEEAQIIFIDRNNNASASNQDDILYSIEPTKPEGILHWRSSLHRPYLSFFPTGSTRGEDGTFWYCQHNKPQATWAIIINQTGRARYLDTPAALTKYPCTTNNPPTPPTQRYVFRP